MRSNLAYEKESHWRSIVKAISWRVIASSTTFIIMRIILQDYKEANLLAGGAAAIDLIIKLILYYLHERTWQSINFGKLGRIIRKKQKK